VRVGVDVQGEAAVAEAVERHGAAYLDRVFTEVEQTSAHLSTTDFTRVIAQIYAAKEAVLKVLGSPGGVPLTDVEILLIDTGSPKVRLGGVARRLAEDQRIGPVMLSTSHDGPVVIAFAIAASDPI
jgi:holo-[acyl-carrier protein] synthase